MDPIDVCRVPDASPIRYSSKTTDAHEVTHAAQQDSSRADSTSGVSAGGSISHEDAAQSASGVSAGASVTQSGPVSSGHKGGSKDEAPAAGEGGAAPSSGKGDAVLSGSLAKAKLQESLGKGDAGGKIEGGGLGAAAGAYGKFQPGGDVQAEAGKIDSGMKFEGKLEGGGLGAGAGAAGMMDKIEDAVKFGEKFKDMPGGGLPGAEKFGDAGGLGGKLAGMGDGSPEGGKFDKGGLGDGKDPGWKQDGDSFGDSFGKKDGKYGVGGKDDKTGGVDSGKKDKTDSTKDTGKDTKKTESSDSGKKTESKTSSDKTDKTKETDSKEKDKKDAKGVGGGGPGDPTGFDDHGNSDPLGFRPRRERNPMPTGEEVGIHHGEGDRGHSNRFSVQGSIHARIQPGGGQDGEYETRAEGPSLLWQLQHYGIDRPETGAVESEAGMSASGTAAAAAASDGPSGSTGQVAGTVRAQARAEDLAAEELPGGSQIPPGAGD